MQIKPDEITSILKSRIEGFEDGGADLSEVGTVLSVADGISRVHGLDNVMSSELLAERHRMPVLFRIRREFEALWADEHELLPVTVTSAVELDEGLVEDIGKRIQEQTGREVELSSHVDPDVLGGLMVRVGNVVLDGTVRNRLERLRKTVAKAA